DEVCFKLCQHGGRGEIPCERLVAMKQITGIALLDERCAQIRHNEVTDEHNVLIRQVDQHCVVSFSSACGAGSITNKNLIFGTPRPQGRFRLSEAFDESRRRCTSALLDLRYLSNLLDGCTAVRGRSRVPNASAFLSAGRPGA